MQMENLLDTIQFGSFKACFLFLTAVKENRNGIYYETTEFKGRFRPWLTKNGLPIKHYRVKKQTDGVELFFVGRKQYWMISNTYLYYGMRLLPLGNDIFALFCLKEGAITIFFTQGINPYSFTDLLTDSDDRDIATYILDKLYKNCSAYKLCLEDNYDK
jgi:hypothetical protein